MKKLFFGGFAGSGTVPGGFSGKFQYRTPRFHGVSCPPCPEKVVRKIFCSTFGEFQGAVLENNKIIVVIVPSHPALIIILVTLFFEKLNFQVFRFLGDFRAPGPFLANSPENFSTERPVFVAPPAPRAPKIRPARFVAQRLAPSKVKIFAL